jgi:hypothetical protein
MALQHSHLVALLLCLLSVLATAEIVASNVAAGAEASPSGGVELVLTGSRNVSNLVPLTRKAATNMNVMARLWLTNAETASNASAQDIIYMSCDEEDYPGALGPERLLREIWDSVNLTAAIFYSRTSDFCVYSNPPAPTEEFPMFSMTNRDYAIGVMEDLKDLPVSQRYFVIIKGTGFDEGDARTQQNQSNPLGPSPSTAVAMIILYSITGIITALFLVIIITGAVRAHRHPDRYGPRDVLGRPRQSRARGIGRAILDTIPIVKFGDREPPKPSDVELAPGAEPDNATATAAESGPEIQREGTDAVQQTDARRESEAEQSGIAAAQPVVAASSASQDQPSQEEGLGCSICTDEFEKGQDIRVLPCNHKFHPDCVDPWLLNVSGTCPLCRVDLRPTSLHSNRSSSITDPDADSYLAPPLQPETDPSHRRRSALRDILNLRSRPNASAEERISALRRLREQRRNQSSEGVAAGSSNLSVPQTEENAPGNRRSRRISARLSGVFGGGRRRREDGEVVDASAPASASASGAGEAEGSRSNDDAVIAGSANAAGPRS